MKDWLVVGIAGTTCSGKTLLSKALKDRYHDSIVIHLDDFFLDVKSTQHVWVPEVNHINFELLSSLDIEGFLDCVRKVLARKNVNGPKLLILDGFILFNEPQIVEFCDIKLFLEVDKETCFRRRSARTYGPPDPPGYFEVCVWPHYLKHRREVKDGVEGVTYLDGKQDPTFLAEKVISLLDVLKSSL